MLIDHVWVTVDVFGGLNVSSCPSLRRVVWPLWPSDPDSNDFFCNRYSISGPYNTCDGQKSSRLPVTAEWCDGECAKSPQWTKSSDYDTRPQQNGSGRQVGVSSVIALGFFLIHLVKRWSWQGLYSHQFGSCQTLLFRLIHWTGNCAVSWHVTCRGVWIDYIGVTVWLVCRLVCVTKFVAWAMYTVLWQLAVKVVENDEHQV